MQKINIGRHIRQDVKILGFLLEKFACYIFAINNLSYYSSDDAYGTHGTYGTCDELLTQIGRRVVGVSAYFSQK
jgi:hypothetical protein